MIRPFQKSDSQKCCAIINACVSLMAGLNQAARELILSKNTPDKLSKELSRYRTVIFEEKSQILGLGALDDSEIKRVYIDPKYQGRGVGSAIMKKLEILAKKQNIKLLITDSSPNAVKFYQKLGFLPIKKDKLIKGKAIFEFIKMQKIIYHTPGV